MSRNYTYEQVESEFNGEITRHVNDSQRVPARQVLDKAGILEHAKRIYRERYDKVLHSSVLDKYR